MLSKTAVKSETTQHLKREHWTQRVKRELKEERALNALLQKFIQEKGFSVSSDDYQTLNVASSHLQPGGDGDDGGSDPEDGDGDEDTPSWKPKGITVRVWFEEKSHDFKVEDSNEEDDHQEQEVKHIKLRCEGFFSILSENIHLFIKETRQEMEEDEILWTYLEPDFPEILEVDMEVLEMTWEDECFDFTFVENYGSRNSFTIRSFADRDEFDIRCILQGRLNIPMTSLRLTVDGEVLEMGQSLNISDDAVIYLAICGQGGTTKKRRCTIADLRPKAGDHALVASCFAIQTFNEEKWLNSLNEDELNDYYKELKDIKSYPAQLQTTVNFIREMKALKD